MEAGETLPPAVRVLNESGTSPIVLLCEHASAFIPASYAGLGLGESDLKRHIAWDIGAADVALRISELIDAPLVIAGYSRLLIDLNRPLGSATSIPEISEDTPIPGNAGMSDTERASRAQRYFQPFHAEVSRLLDERQAQGTVKAVVGIHSFTPVFRGVSRPWHAGILFRKSEAFGRQLVESLGGEGAAIIANEPYQIEDDSDYTVPVHGELRGLDSALVEIRQDLVSDSRGTNIWSKRLAAALSIQS